MRATFLHMADIHLGHRQYKSTERQDDFTRAYLEIIRAAVQRKVDFVLLAGDLFQKRAIDPRTLADSIAGLEQLREAGIPCLAVEGNHELPYYRNRIGWMRFLAERDLLTLLNPRIDGSGAALAPARNNMGAYVEPLPGLRVYGMRYYGASTARVVGLMADALAAADASGVAYTILMAHAGVEGVIDHAGGAISRRELAPLRERLDYLALGHIHKPYEFDSWIYNPGSPETNSMGEAGWTERGYYLVEVDTEARPKHRAVLHANRRRPFARLSFNVDACGTPADLLEQCGRYVKGGGRRFRGENAVVELRLHGALAFDRAALPTEALKDLLEEQFRPLHIILRNDARSEEFALDPGQRRDRPALERRIVTDLFERDARFRARSGAWAELALAIKGLAVANASADAILQELEDGEERIEGRESDLRS